MHPNLQLFYLGVGVCLLVVIGILMYIITKQNAERTDQLRTVFYTQQRVLELIRWSPDGTVGTLSVARSGKTETEMTLQLHKALWSLTRHLPMNISVTSLPVVHQYEHQPGKTYDGLISVEVQRIDTTVA